MIKRIVILFIIINSVINAKADRIYIMNSIGYCKATPEIILALQQNGHSVTMSYSSTLPLNFTSRCIDPINGYDWLCLFGDKSYLYLTNEIKGFIDVGGKVYYQSEGDNGTNYHSLYASNILSFLLNRQIYPDSNKFIGSNQIGGGAWIAKNINCCIDIIGGFYQGFNGIPLKNQLIATHTINGGFPPVSNCPNFGFVFATNDFPSASKKGGIICIGDFNVWYDGGEPFWNGGAKPVSKTFIDFIFPNDSSTCYIFPPGCLTQWDNNILNVSLGDDTIILCEGQKYLLEGGNPRANYIWQDGSKADYFLVAKAGKYWVSGTLNGCTQSDTITVIYKPGPVANLGSDRTLCKGESFTLDVTYPNANYVWQDSSLSASYTISDTGTYWIKVSTSDCTSSDTIVVTKCTLPLNIPNVFTPNEDGINDKFEFENQEDWNFTTQIFNRWGGLVFDDATNQNWDGTFKGKKVPEGVYFFVIQANAITTGEVRIYRGTVSVMY